MTIFKKPRIKFNTHLILCTATTLTFHCHTPNNTISIQRSYAPAAKIELINDQLQLEIKVPIRTHGKAWRLAFITKTPDEFLGGNYPPGYSTEDTPSETIFRWVIPKQLELWFGTDGYLVDLINPSGSKRVIIKLLDGSPDISHWKIGILPAK